MALSGLLIAVVGLGGCALMAVVVVAVVWVIASERKSTRE
jgi:hypothetical protein